MKGLGKIIALILSFLGLSSKATANKKAKVNKNYAKQYNR